MKIIRAEEGIPSGQHSVVALGFFDGVHIGHARLVERAAAIARPRGLLVCVHTFDRMPARVLHPDAKIRELTLLPEKAALLCALGTDVVAVSHFDETMMRMRAKDFFRNILQDKLAAKYVIAGFHHRFGFREEAGVNELSAYCQAANIGLEVISPVTLPDGELVSSTAIRKLLDAGNIPAAQEMLGRPLKMKTGITGIQEEMA